MKQLILLAFFGLAALNVSAQKSVNVSDPGSLVNELVKISSEICDAGVSGNRAAIDKYFAKTYLETDVSGELHDKTWNLNNFLSPNISMSFKIESPQIRQYGTTAILYYTWLVHLEVTQRSQRPGTQPAITKSDAKLQVTDTYVRAKQGWQIVSSSRVRLSS